MAVFRRYRLPGCLQWRSRFRELWRRAILQSRGRLWFGCPVWVHPSHSLFIPLRARHRGNRV